MTAMEEQTAGQTPPTAEPRPETTPSSPPVEKQPPEWSGRAAMPRLSEVVPGWHDGLANRNNTPLGAEDGGDKEDDEGGGRADEIPPHRRKIVRTRAAPAGPHPYLDRFASGMHRPLEG